jgi:CRP/FNR family transcriptional regulator, cyclic AMP receptor protein
MTSTAAGKRKSVFDPNAFLAAVSKGQKAVFFAKKQAIFAQGEVADAVFYVQEGKSATNAE